MEKAELDTATVEKVEKVGEKVVVEGPSENVDGQSSTKRTHKKPKPVHK